MAQGHIDASQSTWCPPGPQVLFCQAVLQLLGPQRVLVYEIVPPQVQDFALPLAEFREIPVNPFLQPVVVRSGLQHDLLVYQSFIVSKLAESALCHNVQVTNEEVEQYET